jgi:hypothetical protein
MNIFVLSNCPIEAATMHCDKHVPKMIVETAQMLCTAAHNITGKPQLYKPCYVNHPCNLWVRQSKENFRWLLVLGMILCHEYTKRFGKTHKTEAVLKHMREEWHSFQFNTEDQTPFALCMPDQYKDPQDAVSSYRNFYNNEKRFAKWERGTPKPEWAKQW